MRKVCAWMIGIVALMLVGCSKSTEADQPEPGPVDDRVPILLGTHPILTSDILSRGIGGVGGTEVEGNNWNGETLFIYGITPDGAPIENQQAVAPTANAKGSISWASGVGPFYYSSSDAYDFYGYHIDDAQATVPVRNEAGAYTLDFTINGTQDLMVASTNKTQDITDSGNAEAVGMESKLYSAWSARRNVVPNLVFQHLLSRLNFKVLAGNAETGNLADKVHISKIEVFSKSAGTLIIIPQGEGEDKTQGIKNMQDIPVDAPLPFLVMKAASDPSASKKLETLVPVAAEIGSTHVGVGLLVYPAESYDVVIHTAQSINGNAKEGTITWKIVPPAPQTAFAAGTAYSVTIKVYKLEEIKVDATLTPWLDGGDIPVDPDDGITS